MGTRETTGHLRKESLPFGAQQLHLGIVALIARLPTSAPAPSRDRGNGVGYIRAPAHMEVDGRECYICRMVQQIDIIDSDRLVETMERLGPDGTAGSAVVAAWIALLLWLGVLDLLGQPFGQKYLLELITEGTWVQRGTLGLMALGGSAFIAALGYLAYRKTVARRTHDRLQSGARVVERRKRMSAESHRYNPNNARTR